MFCFPSPLPLPQLSYLLGLWKQSPARPLTFSFCPPRLLLSSCQSRAIQRSYSNSYSKLFWLGNPLLKLFTDALLPTQQNPNLLRGSFSKLELHISCHSPPHQLRSDNHRLAVVVCIDQGDYLSRPLLILVLLFGVLVSSSASAPQALLPGHFKTHLCGFPTGKSPLIPPSTWPSWISSLLHWPCVLPWALSHFLLFSGQGRELMSSSL